MPGSQLSQEERRKVFLSGACEPCSALKSLESLEICYVAFSHLLKSYGKFGYLYVGFQLDFWVWTLPTDF